jgi:hypothetical protein
MGDVLLFVHRANFVEGYFRGFGWGGCGGIGFRTMHGG